MPYDRALSPMNATDMATNLAAGAAVAVERRDLVHDYILHHVMYHMAEADSWNLPFVHVRALDFLKYDATMLLLGTLLLIAFCGFGYRRHEAVPSRLSSVLEVFVLFIRNNIARAFLEERDAHRLTPLLTTFFFFILTLNLLGLMPIFSAATSNINVTGALAVVTLSLLVGGGIRKRGLKGFLQSFVPAGVPFYLLPVLVPVEVVSFLSKIMALAIRLFANMLAGHVIIFALLGLVLIFGYWALPMVALVVLLYFFELFICVFQAYIFTLLSAAFIGQMYTAEH